MTQPYRERNVRQEAIGPHEREAVVHERDGDATWRDRDVTERDVLESAWVREVAVRDQVRWGPIWGGVVVTMAMLLVLGVLGAALGMTLVETDDGDGALGTSELAWGIGMAVAAFFLGGYVAGRTGTLSGPGTAALNGALVWAASLLIALLLVGFGVGAAVGMMDTFAMSEGDAPRIFGDGEENRLWWTFAALMVGLVAAALGGLVGTPRHGDDARRASRRVV